MRRDVLRVWRAFPEAAGLALHPFLGAAGIRCEPRWWDAVHDADRHPDGYMEAVNQAHLPVPRDGGAGRWAVRELHHPADGRPSSFLAVREPGDAAEMWGAVAAPCTPGAARFAA